LTFNSVWLEPSEGTTPEVADMGMQFELGWFANPIYSQNGDYPEIMKEKIYNKSMEQGFRSSRLPEFTQEEIEYIRGSYDFFGLNHYSSAMMKARTNEVIDRIPSHEDDRDVIQYYDPAWPDTIAPWFKIVPWGLTKLLGWIRRTYGNPELIVFENGFTDRGGTEDDGRVEYYHSYLHALLDAIDEGSKITGYTAWSLMDNFEWMSGYT
jgi:beta-glucosidase/6-phospho-beta-glucosidase/beta-galactosidase